MHQFAVLIFLLLAVSMATADTPVDSAPAGAQTHPQSQPQAQPQPTYSAQPQDPVASYANSYPPQSSTYGGYEAGYGQQNPSLYEYYNNYPILKSDNTATALPAVDYFGGYFPIMKQVFAGMMRVAGKLGLVLLGGAGILLVGMAFTTALCTLTPLCSISFMSNFNLSPDTVRALMTPDKLSATAHLVHEAIDKYQRMQNTINRR